VFRAEEEGEELTMKRRKLAGWEANVPETRDSVEQASKNQSIELQLPVAKGSIGLLLTTWRDDSDDRTEATKEDTLVPTSSD